MAARSPTKTSPAAQCATEEIRCWHDFSQLVLAQRGPWIYRGQTGDTELRSSLERALDNWGIDLSESLGIEHQLVREFARNYQGLDQERVRSDRLYCLALMQHHGAPTRLLDWTYSPFVAAKFAMEDGGGGAVIWCMNGRWCADAAARIVGKSAIEARNTDATRNDSTFVPLYADARAAKRFVSIENPLDLNARLAVQQGVFLCPGDVRASFRDNLAAMEGFERAQNIVKLRLALEHDAAYEFASMLRQMNVTSTVLFPGLDGFARSLGETIFVYRKFARSRTGQPDHDVF